jgi:hypothetical protein
VTLLAAGDDGWPANFIVTASSPRIVTAKNVRFLRVKLRCVSNR